MQGDSVRTGVTAILPHPGNLFFDRVPAAIHVGNGFGKLLGVTQVAELGELETPILLTCTLCVWKAADAMTAYLLELPGMEAVRSINPVVGETNDGYVLNAIRSRPISPGDVRAALSGATAGPVTEGSVGAGTGTIAFGWKGGIGTSSRLTSSRQRLDGGRAGAVEFRWRPPDSRSAGRAEAGTHWGEGPDRSAGTARLDHDRGRDRCAALGPKPSPTGQPRDHRAGKDRVGGRQRLG